MKRYKSLALILAGSMLLSACGQTGGKGETEKNPETEKVTEAVTESESEKEGVPDKLFHFTRDNFPVMDGSTSLAPLGEALASVLLGEDRNTVSDLVFFNKTTQSFRNLRYGECEVVIASEPNPAVFEEMEEEGFAYEMEPICTEALVFVVNEDNPVDSLSTEQIRKIYSGEITNWKEVGGKDKKIEPFVRNAGAGSQVLMEKLVMGDTPMLDCEKEYRISTMGELIEAVKSYDNSAAAIGYTVYYYANDMKMADGLKIISVDDTEPCDETIRKGSYPFTNAYYCAIGASEEKDSPARLLYDWIVSEDGQRLVAAEGYVSILESEEESQAKYTVLPSGISVAFDYAGYNKNELIEEIYQPLDKSGTKKVVASDDYGMLYPYVSDIVYESGEGGYSFAAGYKYGLMDESGKLVTKTDYDEITMARYEKDDGSYESYPFWILSKYKHYEGRSDGQKEDLIWEDITLVSADGSMVIEQKANAYAVGPYGILLFYHSKRFDKDKDGKLTKKETSRIYKYDSFLLLNEKGETVLSSEDCDLEGHKLDYGFSSMGYNSDQDHFVLCMDEAYYIMNAEGKLTAGPYSDIPDMKDGKVIFGLDDPLEEYSSIYGIADYNGKVLVETEWSYIYFGENGYSAYSYYEGDDYKTRIVDPYGNFLDMGNADYVEFYPYGYALSAETETSVYDYEGNIVLTFNPEVSYLLEDIPVMVTEHSGDGYTTLTDFTTGAILTIEDEGLTIYGPQTHNYGEYNGDLSDYFMVYHYDENTERVTRYELYNRKLEKVEDLNFHENFEVLYDDMTHEKYLIRESGNQVQVICDSSLKEICRVKGLKNIYNGNAFTLDDKGCGYRKLDGDLWFYKKTVTSYDD